MSTPAAQGSRLCSNPACPRFGGPNQAKIPQGAVGITRDGSHVFEPPTEGAKGSTLKCSRCKSAHYCDKDCQRAHWKVHKEFCEVWSASSEANNGDIPVAKIKLKMVELIWLTRGMPRYCEYMFSELHIAQRLGRAVCMEYEFETFDELLKVIKFLERNTVVTGEADFHAMVGTPSYRDGPQRIKLRDVKPGQEGAFSRIVDAKMHPTTPGGMPNTEQVLKGMAFNPNLLMLSVTVKLQGTYTTHMFDFLYPRLSFGS